MLTLLLQIELTVMALAVLLYVVRSVNHRQISVTYSLIWVAASIGLLITATFPKIVWYLCQLTGIETPSNVVYLLGLLFLFCVSFSQTRTISKQAEQIKTLTQSISIEKYIAEEAQHDEATGQENSQFPF